MAKNKKLKKEDFISDVYSGKIRPDKLSEAMYYETANVLKAGAYKGYGGTMADFQFDTADFETLSELRANVYFFSAAKTFQQTLEMSEALTNGDTVLSYKEFREEALKIFEKYNGEEIPENANEATNWLKAEYDTAIGMSRAAAKWTSVSANKSEFPYLRYVAVMDAHTCEICAPLDGITLPVDDGFWDANMPLNHFSCECVVEQLDEQDVEDEGGVSEADEVSEKVTASHETKNELFNMNPGKDKAIFKDTGKNKHPYFDVSARYKELAMNNFNLPIPEND